MKNSTRQTVLLIVLFISTVCWSQQWIEDMQDPNANFYETQKKFEAYWSQPDKVAALERFHEANRNNVRVSDELKAEVAGWKIFKRWEHMKEGRVFPDGTTSPNQEYFETLEAVKNTKTMAGGWYYVGPTMIPSGGGGAGRVNGVRYDPQNTSVIYACTPGGGLWKSTNAGVGWSVLNTDNLGSLGVSDIAIDPSNSNTLYIASGDGDGSDTYSLGVLKSTDGGLTWNTTGLNWVVTQKRRGRKILVDPNNPQIIHVATTNGVYRSTDGGTTFSQTANTSMRDIEFKPGDPTTVYASSGSTVWRSTNSGASYSSIHTVSGSSRLAIAVTTADPNYLYVLSSNGSGGFNGVQRSTDGGATFSTMSTSPNILGYSSSGSGSGGQGTYDLAIAANPVSKDEVVIGGINIWRSTNGGSSWSIIGHWTGSGGAPYVHADVHDLVYEPTGVTLYAGCDGGVFKTNNAGGSWQDVSLGLEISQSYRLGQSSANPDLLLTGRQDNGTDRMSGTNWTFVIGGDGMECFIDRTNDNQMFGEIYYGDFRRSTNGGNSFSGITSGLSGSAAWVTPWMQDPQTPATLWAGYTNVFKSTNNGTNWTQTGSLGGSGTIRSLDVAPSNPQFIYAARTSSIHRSVDGGSTWTPITGGLLLGSNQITYIEIDDKDENHLWITISGYSNNNKVWESTNAGMSWTNISTGIPNIPTNCIVLDTTSINKTLYAGTDLGVYYRDNTMSSWQSFNTNLPNVTVMELEVHYAVNRIRAATYGRGIWESALSGLIAVDGSEFCKDDCLQIIPNPSKGKFSVFLKDDYKGLLSVTENKPAGIEVRSALGQLVYETKAESLNDVQIDLGEVPVGIYFLQVKIGDKNINRKLIIN